jgi:hypothetical protein
MAEIKLRASVRIGELIRELEKEQGARTDLEPCASVGTKSKAIGDAGLSLHTALPAGRKPRRPLGLAAAMTRRCLNEATDRMAAARRIAGQQRKP